MGRGRAKAKQQKVARDLKYTIRDTDFSALQKELSPQQQAARRASADDSDSADDPYADYDDDEEDSWAAQSH